MAQNVLKFICMFSVCAALFLCGCTGSNNGGGGLGNNNNTNAAVTTFPQTNYSSLPIINGSFQEQILNYDNIAYSGLYAGSPIYVATTGVAKSVILYQGKEIGKGYESAQSPVEIAGKLAYIASNNSKSVVVYDGKELGSYYFDVWSLGEYNGKPIYVAEKQGRSVIIYDGSEIGSDYDWVWSYRLIGGKLAYTASKNGETYVSSGIRARGSGNKDASPYGVKNVIVFDGKEIGREYLDAESPVDNGGAVAYIALKTDRKYVVVSDGKEISKEYTEIKDLSVLNGKLAYFASLGGKNHIVYDGKEYGGEYDNVFDYSSVGGGLAYTVEKDSRRFVVYNGKEMGREFNMNYLSAVKDLDGVSFLTKGGASRLFYVYYKGNLVKTTYDKIDLDSLRVTDGKLSFIAIRKNIWYDVKEA